MKTKRSKPQRARKGQGSVVPYGENQWRARKRKKGFPDLFGTVRETYVEAETDLSLLDFEEAYGKATAPGIPTLRDFMRQQIESPGPGRKAPRAKEVSFGTWKREEIVLRTRVRTSDLGRKRLDEITPEDCQAFLDEQTKLAPERDKDGRIVLYDLEGCKLDRSTKHKDSVQRYVPTGELLDREGLKRVGAVLGVHLEKARSKKIIAHNPMSDVSYPKLSRQLRAPKRKALTPQKAAGLRANVLEFRTSLGDQGERFEAMVMTQRDTGFRRGELCGLLRDRVRKNKRTAYIVVDVARARGEKGFVQAPTKSGSIREVPIGQETYDRIMALPARVDPGTGLVFAFSTESGRPVSPDNYNRSFRAFREAIGMPELAPHNLRHTYISLMLRAGVDPKTIQKNVGHASHRMIMEVYGETFDESQAESVGRFFDVLKEAEGGVIEEGKPVA